MEMINLTMTQYRNYAKIHRGRNFGQTIEYTTLKNNISKKKIFLGLKDDNNNIYAATLLLVHEIVPGIKEAEAPDGFLIDYANFDLVRTFVTELKSYLQKEKVTYLITDPVFAMTVYNRKGVALYDNRNLLDNLLKLDFINNGYNSCFEKYDVIIDNNNSINDIYRHFNRNTKRNIKEGLTLGLTLHRGTVKDLDEAYKIFKKKTNMSLSYYRDLMNNYNNKDNKMEVFFAKINPHKYLVNIKAIYEEELRKNEQIHDYINSHVGKNSEQLINKKINSDNTLEKYRYELNRAIKLNQKYTDSIIIGTSIIIKNNHEIYFLIDGYKEEFRNIHSTHVLKWAIICKYFNEGYHLFNLGEIYDKEVDALNKYYGQYIYKTGFGGNTIEYPPHLLLVTNKTKYNLYTKLIKRKK